MIVPTSKTKTRKVPKQKYRSGPHKVKKAPKRRHYEPSDEDYDDPRNLAFGPWGID